MSNIYPSDSVIKVAQALAYLLSMENNNKMNRVRLIKLLWAADRLHLRRYGRTITESGYFALKYGPVNSLALNIASLDKKHLGRDVDFVSKFFQADVVNTEMIKSPGDDYLSKSEKEMLCRAFDMFAAIKDFDLAEDISHQYPEWKNQRHNLNDKVRRSPINKLDFFKQPAGDDKYFSESDDELAMAKEIFKERQAVSKLPGYIGGE